MRCTGLWRPRAKVSKGRKEKEEDEDDDGLKFLFFLIFLRKEKSGCLSDSLFVLFLIICLMPCIEECMGWIYFGMCNVTHTQPNIRSQDPNITSTHFISC